MMCEHHVRPQFVIWRIWIIFNVAKVAICDFGNASSHEVVEIERDRAIRNSFVSEQVFLNSRVVLIMEKHSHVVFRTNDIQSKGCN